jgi:hypothetical protein
VSDVLIGKVRRDLLWNGQPGPRNRNDVGRRTPLLAYVLAGPRVSEGCGLDGQHLDLASHPGRVRIAVTKTSAGDALERVMGCSLDEAYELLGGRLGRARASVPNLYPATESPPCSLSSGSRRAQKPP